MNLFRTLYETFLEALFPLHASERQVLSYSPEEAWAVLPPAPGYEGLAVKLPEARSIFAYKDERVAKLIWSIEYKKSLKAAEIGGFAVGKTIREWNKIKSDQPIMIVPMPITKKRRRERGYNQCEILVDQIKGFDVENSLKIEKDLLIRVQHSSRQTLKDRKERIKSAAGIFAVDEKVLGKLLLSEPLSLAVVVVIVDDVITTGSTIKEAIDTMKKAGFENVYAISIAH